MSTQKVAKGVFFSESAMKFFQISKSQIFQKPILGGKFKFQAQDSFLEYFFWDLEIWKSNLTFWKKATFKKTLKLLNCSLHSTHILPFGIFHFLLYQLFLPDGHCGHPQVFLFFGLSLYGLFFGFFCSLLGHHLPLPLGNFNPTGIMAGDLQRFSISLYLSLSPPWCKPAYPVARLPSVPCYLAGLEPVCCKKRHKKVPTKKLVWGNRGPLKALNDTKLILND